MAGTRKTVENENLTDANIAKVISLLNPTKDGEKPITKKSACEILRISYNTARLDMLIRQYKEKVENDKLQRAKRRFTPATQAEKELIITSYLEGDSMADIAKRIYRSANFVSNILERYGCPRRGNGNPDYWHPELIPEKAMKLEFAIGEKVWSARYKSMARIESVYEKQPGVYRIWLESEATKQFAYQPYWELASLEHLKQQGITI